MSKVKIEVVNAVINGKQHGETLLVDKADAETIVERGRGVIVEEKATAKKVTKKDEEGDA